MPLFPQEGYIVQIIEFRVLLWYCCVLSLVRKLIFVNMLGLIAGNFWINCLFLKNNIKLQSGLHC